MKKMLAAVAFAAFAVSSPAHALNMYIRQMPISDLQCHVARGSNTYSFVAHWGALVDVKTKQLWINPKTGKPWPTYKVGVRSGCTVPNNTLVDCGGAAECSVVVTCPITSIGTSVNVVGVGTPSSWAYTQGGRKPEGCN